METKLPNKLSDLILLALEDMEKCGKDPRYILSMALWHQPAVLDRERCHVCLAGSVIAQSLGASPEYLKSPVSYEGGVAAKLYALNDIRGGNFDSETIGRAFPEAKGHRKDLKAMAKEYVAAWSAHDPEEITLNLSMIAGQLQEMGL